LNNLKLSNPNMFIIIGVLLGAFLGGLGGWAYIQAQQNGGLWTKKREHGREVAVQAGVGDYFRIGMAVYGLIRMVQGLVKLA
jgi:hypothetical protein